MAFYLDTVDILKPPLTTNRAGEQVPDYRGLGDAEGIPWGPVQVRPFSQTEAVTEDRQTALSTWRIASHPGEPAPDLDNIDWVRLSDGTVCSVVGDIAKPTDPITGVLHHVEVTVQRANR